MQCQNLNVPNVVIKMSYTLTNMPVSLLYFLIGLVLLLISSKILVNKSQKIAHKLHLSPLIVGITIVAVGTSLPELAVSVISSIKGDYGLSIGNIVGSNITNILLILSVAILLGKLRIGTTKTPKTTGILVFVTLLYLLLHAFSVNHTIAGILLISLGVIFTIIEYKWGVEGQNKEDFTLLSKFSKSKIVYKNIDLAYLALSIVGIAFGGFIIVNSTEQLSLLLGYSTTILGLGLTSLATSLPELLTTVFSQQDKNEKLTMGNILGSNVYNILFIGGLSYLFSNGQYILDFEWVWFVASVILLYALVVIMKGKYIPKFFGLLFLSIYLVYLATLL